MDGLDVQPFLLPFVVIVVALIYKRKWTLYNALPSPPSFPLIGHLHLLKHPVHRTFHQISQKYGPVFFFRFGSHPAVIVSSLSVAQECFTKNDVVLADRPRFSTVVKHLNYNFTTIASASYGDHWRNMRRIGAIEIFSAHRLNLFANERHDEVRSLLVALSRDSRERFAAVELKTMIFEMNFNNIMRMVAGKRYYGQDVAIIEEAAEFKSIIGSIFAKAGVGHIEDYLPFMQWINGGKFEKEIISLADRTDRFLQSLIDSHRTRRKQFSKSDEASSSTMIDHLLSLPDDCSDDVMKGLIMIMLLAGTETSAVTIEWAMAHLVNNPEILNKAMSEIDEIVGEERLITETDIAKLEYLQAVVTETMRVQPPAPLLVPHYSAAECVIGGYKVPRRTMVVVNAWAIHRDPVIWDDPETFRPERFVGELSAMSQLLMPFGLGRRACPGSGLAHRVVCLTLGSLMQCFEWRRVSDEFIDMAEGVGTVISKAKPLVVACKARNIVSKLFPV